MFGSGKCFKKDCGCQKFWQKLDSDTNMCGCEHHEAFHEQKPTGENFMETSPINLEEDNVFLTTNQVSHEINAVRSSNVRAFLNSEELKGKLSAISTSNISNTNDSNVNKRLYFNLQKESSKYKFNLKNKIKKNKVRTISYEFILIPKKSVSSIPKKGNELWGQLTAHNLLRKITFNEDSEEHVNNQIVAAFPCLIETGWICYKTKSTSELEPTPFEPNKPKDLNYIKRVSTSKSKVYIKPIIDSLCESSDDSSDDSLDDFSSIEELSESPNGSLQELIRNFRYNLQDINNTTTKVITVNENTIIESLLQWAKDASDKDLLQRPSIELVLEDVTDTGGVFRQVTSMFWNKIRDCQLYFTDGLIEISSECHTLGKILFWTILHCGMWPQWLHKSHIKYIFDEKIEVKKVLKEYNPQLYENLKNKKPRKFFQEWKSNRNVDIDIEDLSKKEVAAYIAEYEIITIRKQALDELKLGFSRFNIVNELKNYNYNNIVRELYYKLTYDIVIAQFDSEYIDDQAQSLNKPQYQLLYDKLKELLKTMNEDELKNVMKFITGAEIIPASPKIKISWIELKTEDAGVWFNRLPHASTCGNLLTICENYELTREGFEIFKQDLYNGFINHEGFSEPVYSRNYDNNFILQNEINNNLQQRSSSDSTTTVRSQVGDSIDNAISVGDEPGLTLDSHQVNTNPQNYRWINVSNPLQRRRRRRRESADF